METGYEFTINQDMIVNFTGLLEDGFLPVEDEE